MEFCCCNIFLLVGFLVPFAMAYVKLVPFTFDNIFSLSSVIIYNTFIVLIPIFTFRIVLIPMRRLWESRHQRIEILQAEVARDQIFLPLLREWIVELQNQENAVISFDLTKKIRSFMLKIGKQKFFLVNKIHLINKRRKFYLSVLFISYLGVCLIEILFLTSLLPTPQFLANKINKILSFILLD